MLRSSKFFLRIIGGKEGYSIEKRHGENNTKTCVGSLESIHSQAVKEGSSSSCLRYSSPSRPLRFAPLSLTKANKIIPSTCKQKET